jgi:hypothetical protein
MVSNGKSTYVLETSVGPGGSRWAEIHAYSSRAHIKACLESFCANQAMEAYHAIWYGAVLAIYTVQRGAVVACLDLHPYLSAQLEEEEPLPLTQKDKLCAMVRARRPGQKAQERGGEPGDEEDEEEIDPLDDWDDSDIATFDAFELSFDWPAIERQLAPLEEPLLGPNESTRIELKIKKPEDAYLTLSKTLEYGSEDREAGERIAPPPGIERWKGWDTGLDGPGVEDDDEE